MLGMDGFSSVVFMLLVVSGITTAVVAIARELMHDDAFHVFEEEGR